MPYFETRDKTSIYYKEWGAGEPVVFSHGWPLSADAWDDQMLFLASKGFRCIAHDRRGHGRSGQPGSGNDMDSYADDLFELLENLRLRRVTLVGHSTGGGEVVRCFARHGPTRIARLVLIAAVPPLMLKTKANPGGLPIEAFDMIREQLLRDRAQFFQDLSGPFFGANREGSRVSFGLRNWFWMQGMMGGLQGQYDCVRQFSETNFTEDLKGIEVPTLLIHGDDDQVVPIEDSSMLTARLVKGARLVIVPGAPHGLCSTHKDQVNSELWSFLKGPSKPAEKEGGTDAPAR